MIRLLPLHFVIFLIVFIIVLAPSVPVAAQNGPSPASDLVIILDASGSMWGQIDGENKIVIARRVLMDLVGKLPDGTGVGLVAYGHRREGDCEDIETVLALEQLDREGFSTTVDRLNPKGKTPITKSIEHTVRMLESHDGPVTVILVSDGLETCSGDPCAAARLAREDGVELLMHVVGFDMGDADVSTLQCAAAATGGRYYDVRSADELAAALEEVVESPVDTTDSVISLRATANGELVDVGVRVYDVVNDTVVAFQRTYTGEETNPRYIGVNAGTYDLDIKAISLKGDVSVSYKGVEVAAGDTLFRVVDFSPGTLAVGVTRNGALSDATVNIYKAGTSERVAGGRTYRSDSSNPKESTVTAGYYDVAIGSVEIEGGPKHQWEGVRVSPDSTTRLQHEFVSGSLRVGAVVGSELVDATVNVTDRTTGRSVAGTRTYTAATSNPTTFVLTPGDYSVVVKAVRLDGSPTREFDTTVDAGVETQYTVDFQE